MNKWLREITAGLKIGTHGPYSPGYVGRDYIVAAPQDIISEAPPSDLEWSRNFILDHLGTYRWYETYDRRAAIHVPLLKALEQVLSYCIARDHRFLTRDWLARAAVALMEMSWTEARVVELNQLGQKAYEYALKRHSGILPPVARHLYHHNRIASRGEGCYAAWGLFSEPKGERIADCAIEQGENAWEPLLEPDEALPFWSETLEEMIAYQRACRIVFRTIHRSPDRLREAKDLLLCLREQVQSNPQFHSYLMRAELAYALATRRQSPSEISLIDLLEKYVHGIPSEPDPVRDQMGAIMNLNLLGESGGSYGDVGVLANVWQLTPVQRSYFLLRDKHNLLPSARRLLFNYGFNNLALLPLSERERLIDLLSAGAF